ncbi:DUF2244 domain-containing protein [Piscinibacter sakaiensis]|uniref:DUF2244 domain-containing protein n=1 Tax=Piscinibacter sakaiensis TaxID=1547922 RepID=UPI003AAE5827
MSATTSRIDIAVARPDRRWQFGRETSDATGDWQIEWLLKRNCSLAPAQMLGLFAALCVVSLSIALFFWLQGATLVMPFAWLELIAVGGAMLLYARHAADRERIELHNDMLTVEHACGNRLERVEFQAAWVRIEPRTGDHSLVELTGQGRRIFVGRFVRPELRRKLADELRAALRRPNPRLVQAV